MTQPSPDPNTPTPTTVTITVQSSTPVPSSTPTPTAVACEPACDHSACLSQCKCINNCNSGYTDKCESTCSHIQKVILHRKDRETIAEISERISTVATRLETLTDISTHIQSVAVSLQNQPTDSTIQESHIYKLSQNIKQIATAIDRNSNHQEVQKATLTGILDALQSINTSLKSQNPEDIRSAARSLAVISTTLKNLKWPLFVIAGFIFLLPFVFRGLSSGLTKIINSTPASSFTPTPVSIPIPVPSPVYSPTPILIPVPSPVYKPVSLWTVHCPPGYNCLRMRESPQLSAHVVKLLPCNTSGIQITGPTVARDGEDWAPVDYQMPEGRTISGWVVRRFLLS